MRCVETLQQILRLLAKNRELVSLRAQLEKAMEVVAADPARASDTSSSNADARSGKSESSNSESKTISSDAATNTGAATAHPALTFALGAIFSAAVALIYVKRWR